MERYTQVAKSEVTKQAGGEGKSEHPLQKEGWSESGSSLPLVKKLLPYSSVEDNTNLPELEILFDKGGHETGN